MGTNPGFDLTTARPWKRVSAAARASSNTVLGMGELAVTETGDVFRGNGATALKNLSPLVDAATVAATYATKAQLGAITTVDNGNGTATITATGSSTTTDNGNGTASIAA